MVGYGIGPRLEGDCGIGLCSMGLKILRTARLQPFAASVRH